MELCEFSLDQLLLTDYIVEKYSETIVIKPEDIVLQLACGLEYIHGTKLIHGNLKPENALVLVKRQRLLMKWSDPGLRRPQVHENDAHNYYTSGVRFTYKWSAPETMKIMEDGAIFVEQAANTTKNDVFAEGLVFAYIFLQGKHPYGEKYSTHYNIVEGEPVELKSNTHKLLNLGKISLIVFFCQISPSNINGHKGKFKTCLKTTLRKGRQQKM